MPMTPRTLAGCLALALGLVGCASASRPVRPGPCSQAEAVSRVAAVPEVAAWTRYIERAGGGRHHVRLVAEGDDRYDGHECWAVAFMEDNGQARHRWETFCVRCDTGEVLVLDLRGDGDLLTLAQWREAGHSTHGIGPADPPPATQPATGPKPADSSGPRDRAEVGRGRTNSR